MVAVAALAAIAGSGLPVAEMALTLCLTRSAASTGKRSKLVLCRPVFDRQIAAFDEAGFGKAAAERSFKMRGRAARPLGGNRPPESPAARGPRVPTLPPRRPVLR